MPSIGLALPTGLYGTADFPWTVTLGGTVVYPEWPSVELGEDASGEASYFRFRVWDPDNSLAVVEQMPVRVQDNPTDEPVFLGFVQRRSFDAQAVGRWIAIEAVSIGAWLDEILVPLDTRPSGESDLARIGYLWGRYAREPLSFDLSFVTQVRASMPADLFQNLTLRTALDQVASQAGDTVRWYVDAAGRLHYFSGTEAALVAPYNVNVALAPGSGNIAPDDLDVEYDGKIVNRVYVRGANAEGSGWYQDDASVLRYGPVEGYLDAPNADTAAKALSTARLYLGRVAAARARGTFTTGHPYTGWQAGQSITVTSPQHDLASFATRIVRITHRFAAGDGRRILRIEFNATQARSSGVSAAGGLGQDIGVPGQVIAGSIFDSSGNPLFDTGTSGGGASPFGPAARRYILSGFVNGDFALAPPALNAEVTPANPIPYWTCEQVSGSAITAVVVPDAAQASGHTLEFRMAPGAAGDEAYIEQIIPINASRSQAYITRPWASVEATSAPSGERMTVAMQFLRRDGSTTGSGTVVDVLVDPAFGIFELGSNLFSGIPPSDAAFLRVRFGVRRATAATSKTNVFRLYEAYRTIGPPRLDLADIQGAVFPAVLQLDTGITGWNGLLVRAPSGFDITAVAKRFVVYGETLERHGGLSFPASPATGDQFYRTDLGMWFLWDGTRWACTCPHETVAENVGITWPLSASVGAGLQYLPVPDLGMDILVDKVTAFFFVASGGSALSSSHKWGIGVRVLPSASTFTTVTIDSGASNAYRWLSTSPASVVDMTSDQVGFDVFYTRTGTPGNLRAAVTMSFRYVAT